MNIYKIDEIVQSFYESAKKLHDQFDGNHSVNEAVDQIVDDAFNEIKSGSLEYKDQELTIVIFGPDKLVTDSMHCATISFSDIFYDAAGKLGEGDESDVARAESLRVAGRYLIEQADALERLSL